MALCIAATDAVPDAPISPLQYIRNNDHSCSWAGTNNFSRRAAPDIYYQSLGVTDDIYISNYGTIF